ncbi:BTF2-like transcription factor [Hibiscus syriacus]|uniref:BTF2-like transcription factor n=1 Tax=Hibiscus syriacus TaxID=106335 RepID=A0A6A2ZI55_HIBSY|nr:BTF2-like transcription factor [Hibiscus syriacus]
MYLTIVRLSSASSGVHHRHQRFWHRLPIKLNFQLPREVIISGDRHHQKSIRCSPPLTSVTVSGDHHHQYREHSGNARPTSTTSVVTARIAKRYPYAWCFLANLDLLETKSIEPTQIESTQTGLGELFSSGSYASVKIELEDTKAVAEALAQSKRESSKKGESDGDTSRERLDRLSRMTEIEYLQGSNSLPLAPLCIKDPQDYFDSQQANALRTSGDALGGTEQIKCSLSIPEVYGSLRAFISSIKAMGLNEPIVKPEVAHQVFDALTYSISNTKHNILGKILKRVFWTGYQGKLRRTYCISIIETSLCFQHWTSIIELLKHFWSSYPITTSYLYVKVVQNLELEIKGSVPSELRHQSHEQMVLAAHEVAVTTRVLWHEISYNTFIAVPSGNAYYGILSLEVGFIMYNYFSEVHSLVQALGAAIQHYEASMQKRSTQSGEKPNGYM